MLLPAMLLASCNDYLDTIPSKGNNEMLHSVEQAQAIFNNHDNFVQTISATVPCSDDMGLSTDLYDAIGYMTEDNLNGFTFDKTDLMNAIYGDDFWDGAYNKVFKANLIINSIDQIEDATEEQKAEILAQAHFLRAASMWNLVQTYCQPYSEETLSTPGLPLKTTTDYDESKERATLADTYAFILNDLNEAMKTSHEDVGDRWLASRPAVEAMMARYYLFTCDYAKAETYAKQALQSSNATLEDYNTYTTNPTIVNNPETNEPDTVFRSQLYSYAPNEVTAYAENYYSGMWKVRSGIYLIPSEELLSLYDHDNDLRYSQFFNKHDMWSIPVSGFGDDILYRRMQTETGDDLLPSGPTVPEMILTAAEAMARQNKVSEAMEMVNRLRRARIRSNADDVLLTASSQQDAVEKILDERHREMPFVSRWQDIRRLAYNEVTYDDITVTRVFYGVVNSTVDYYNVYSYVLPVKSARYAQPITNLEIRRSGNQIVQNEYTDNDVLKESINSDNNEE